MLVDGVRFCDACNRVISDGERYVVSTIPQERAALFLTLFARTENAANPDVEPDGSVQLTICRSCELDMARMAGESVN